MNYKVLTLFIIGGVAACGPTVIGDSASDVKQEVDKRVPLGMSKNDALKKMSDIGFACAEGAHSLHCSRTEEGVVHINHEEIPLFLSFDKSVVTSISPLKFQGQGM